MYFTYINSEDNEEKENIIAVFSANFIFNILWSFLFFYMRNPLLAFIEIFVLLASILLMIFVAGKINKVSGYLLVPYLLWVCFALILNLLAVKNA